LGAFRIPSPFYCELDAFGVERLSVIEPDPLAQFELPSVIVDESPGLGEVRIYFQGLLIPHDQVIIQMPPDDVIDPHIMVLGIERTYVTGKSDDELSFGGRQYLVGIEE